MKAKSRLKLKRDNDTPEKMSDDSRNINDTDSSNKVNESFDELKITEELLQKFYNSSAFGDDFVNNTYKFAVRYELPPDKQKPKTKKICVLKKAPMNAAAVPSSTLLEQMTLRIDDHQRPVQHSILGSLEDFFKMSLAKKTLTLQEIPSQFQDLLDQSSCRRDITSFVPKATNIYNKDNSARRPIIESSRVEMDPDTRALKLWKLRMMERRNLQSHLSKKVKRLPESLIFNSGEDFREKMEHNYLVSKSIPFYGAGYGFRSGSEFWKQNEIVKINNGTELHMSNTQAEKGYPPSIIHVGVSNQIKQEKGVPIIIPKKHTEYESRRQNDLHEIMHELDPHQPELESLIVTGSPLKYTVIDELQTESNDFSDAFNDGIKYDSFASQPFSRRDTDQSLDQTASILQGPCLYINSLKLKNQQSDDESSPLEIRVIFNDYTMNTCLERIHFHNKGSSIIRFCWKKLEVYDPFQLDNKGIRHFYFNTQDGILLPNEEMFFPVIFKSHKSGIFVERWRLETLPTVANGRDIVIYLKGVALQRDIHANARKNIENYLKDQVGENVVHGILNEIVDALFYNVKNIPTTEEQFQSNEDIFRFGNEKIFYDMDNVNSLKKLHETLPMKEGQITEEWNLSCQKLKNDIYSNETLKSVKKEETYEKFYKYVDKLMIKSIKSDITQRDSLYRIAYRVFMDFGGDMFTSLASLRRNHELPEMELQILREKKGSNLCRQKTNNSQSSKISAKKTNEIRSNTMKMKSKEPSNLLREPTDGLITEIEETEKLASRSTSDFEELPTDNEQTESIPTNSNLVKYSVKSHQVVYALLDQAIDNIISLWQDLSKNKL